MSLRRRRVVHVVYRFDVGGLENVIVQLINRLPEQEFEHVVLSLTEVSDFSARVARSDTQFVALNKAPGHALPLYPRIWHELRRLKADVVHTCNLAALEVAPVAWAAGVPLRIHAEHGWDMNDRQGTNPRYRLLRRIYRPFVNRYIAVSQDLADYLRGPIGVPPQRVSLIANGVDTESFRPCNSVIDVPEGMPFEPGKHFIIGTIGRLQAVKNQAFLARAFVQLVKAHPEAASRLRLAVVGDGPDRASIEQVLIAGGVRDFAWLPGSRSDIPVILRALNVFVLPSYAEGTSCTLQEAMATGIPAVATAVGGTPKVIQHDHNGWLLAPDDDAALAAALWRLYTEPEESLRLATAARSKAVSEYSLDSMVQQYRNLFCFGSREKTAQDVAGVAVDRRQ